MVYLYHKGEVMDYYMDYVNNTNLVNNQTGNIGRVTSNLEYVKSHMASINNKVNNVISDNNEKHSFESIKDGNILYSRTNNIISSYYECQNKLMNKINNEVKYIVGVAEAYEDLDKELSSKVGDL